jgi:hypothetical protein
MTSFTHITGWNSPCFKFFTGSSDKVHSLLIYKAHTLKIKIFTDDFLIMFKFSQNKVGLATHLSTGVIHQTSNLPQLAMKSKPFRKCDISLDGTMYREFL